MDEHGGEQCLEYTSEKRKGKQSLARWDFYLQDEQLLALANGTQKAMCVKMWRRGDFDRLNAHLQKLQQAITVEDCLSVEKHPTNHRRWPKTLLEVIGAAKIQMKVPTNESVNTQENKRKCGVLLQNFSENLKEGSK